MHDHEVASVKKFLTPPRNRHTKASLRQFAAASCNTGAYVPVMDRLLLVDSELTLFLETQG
jgi:hypothetical protein